VNETPAGTGPNWRSNEKPRFFIEFAKEFVSALVVILIVWVLARLFHVETESLEFVAAPVILAWFTVRGWRTEDPTWPFRRRIWKFLARFLLATAVVVGMPLLVYSVVYGTILLLKLHRPPYLLISGYLAAIIVSSALVWVGRKTAVRLGMSFLGLSHATVAAKARFAFYWLVSLALVANAVWPEGPEFNTLCDAARQAGRDIVDPVRTSLEGMQFSECVIRTQGEGYAVTIGAVSGGEDHRRPEIIHYKAVVYPDGEAHHLELIRADPRGDGSAPRASKTPENSKAN
jgi:hypothetical protein